MIYHCPSLILGLHSIYLVTLANSQPILFISSESQFFISLILYITFSFASILLISSLALFFPCWHEFLGKVGGELGGVGRRKAMGLSGGTICVGSWKSLVRSWEA